MESKQWKVQSKDRSLDEKFCFRLNTLLYEFQLIYNSADVALKYDEVEPLEDIVDELIKKYGEFNISREQLLTIGNAELESKRLQKNIRAKGSVKFPADVSFEDLMDVVDESVASDIQKVAEPLVSSVVTTIDGSGGIASSAIAHELIARLQTLGNVMRSGVLSIACGALERHLTRLASLKEELPEAGSRPLSARDLMELTSKRLGEVFDKRGGLSEQVNSIFTERNSIIHREGRVDSVFQNQMKNNPVSEEEMGAILDLTDEDLRGKLDCLLAYALRSAFLDWCAIDGEKPYLHSTLSFTQVHLLAQEHWVSLALVSDEAFEAMDLDDIRPSTRVNYLLALKHFVGGEVSAEYEQRVRDWEAPKGDTWLLAKLALLDQNDAAVALILEHPELRDLLEPINRVFVDLMTDPRLFDSQRP
jgi:hypothetical protein